MIDFRKELFLDGAMGSELIERSGKPVGYRLELLNLEAPRIVERVHRDYIRAGCDVIYTNTFGANEFKFGDDTESVIRAGVEIARRAAEDKAYVALDIGPLGKLIGEGGISFDQAYETFRKIVIAAQDRTDYIVIETMTDLAEARAALLAVKENSELPVAVSMSFAKNGRTAFGCGVENFAITAGALGADLLGINCSLGPKEMLPFAQRLTAATPLPVFIKPNAGMPRYENGRTVYDVDEEEFAQAMLRIRACGVGILGGCCGTTPEYLRRLRLQVRGVPIRRAPYAARSRVCSAIDVVTVDEMKIVGERVNPTGKKRFQQALRDEDYDYILAQGVEQANQGAHILDVNVGINGIDECKIMRNTVEGLQRVTTLPLQIDSSSPEVIAQALRYYHGKAIVNSVNGKRESLEAILPIAKKYGAAVIGLTLDERGIPKEIGERVEIARTIVDTCVRYGIAKEDVYIDTLTMAEAAESGSALCTLGALCDVKKLGVRTVLGVSNVSFGMPNREDINAKFLEMARRGGLDLCIINPKLKNLTGSRYAEAFLKAEQGAVQAYLDYAAQVQDSVSLVPAQGSEENIESAIISGQGGAVAKGVQRLLLTLAPLEVASRYIVPALDRVGALYESGKLFLPQLIAAADAAKRGFDLISAQMEREGQPLSNRVFVLATVKGDIHDIGKNIVKAVVSNYGYRVIDLGRDVEYEKVLEAVRTYNPCVLGLSALMTTTAQNMAQTIRIVREEFPDLKILVGGAVLTPQYAESIGGIYCADANDTVRKLKEIFA